MADWNLSTNMIPIGHAFIKDDIRFMRVLHKHIFTFLVF